MTDLFRKLNFKDQSPILILDPPPSFEGELAAMAKETRTEREAAKGSTYGFSIAFARMKPDFDKVATILASSSSPEAVIWIAYPKKSSPALESDLSRDGCFEAGFTFGLKANRQVAIDEDWSAMRYKRL